MKLFENASSRLVLIVDGNPELCESASNELNRSGYATATAESIEHASKYLKAAAPFAILLSDTLADSEIADIFLTNARQHYPPPVVVLLAGEASRAAMSRLNIRERLPMPLNIHQLTARINRIANEVPATVSADALRDLRVMIVDDEIDTCSVLSCALRGHGANTVTAISAHEALARIDEFSPQILLTDIRMPEEDGYSMLRKIRSKGNTLPAIAFTAHCQPEDRERALAEGFRLHLKKPLDPIHIVHAVAMCVAGTL
jgi:CheY-like chemotaxis protein